ncbi:serine hydrolase domain-containing protein [Fodinicola acaciae]|uniref:serine hydrolase domain-containing protein n=1 Tax=Fodinicola acaciae TaxID=2681555 RepID=UPI0013D63595|nr:serine hydrolase domain-containing protein [Fodinicola acaciae]
MRLKHLTQALDEYVPVILDHCEAPGMTIAIGAGDRVVWTCGYGLADVAENRPMTAETVGPTGSDAKPYTAVAAMQLVERGIIGLDDPVNHYLDGWRIKNPYGDREITLRDLLTHRSGLGTGMGNCDRVPPGPLGEHLRKVFEEQRSDAYGGMLPFWGTKVDVNYQYSNVGIALVGYLVELLNPERLTFSDYVDRHIFQPLRMTSTAFPPAQHPDHVSAELLARRSTGYATLPGLRCQLPPVYPADYPAGTALTTPGDHVRFLLAMTAKGGRILQPRTARRMLTPQAGRGPDPSATIGLVWSLFHHGEENAYFGHGGEYMWGWNQVSRCWPRQRIAVTANTNQWDLGDLGTSERPSHLAGRLVLGIVTAWVEGRDPRPARCPAAGLGYLAGVIVADRLTARLGIRTPPTKSEIDEIARSAHLAGDRDAFRQGMVDLVATDGTLPALVELSRRELPDHEIDVLKRQLGVPKLGIMV